MEYLDTCEINVCKNGGTCFRSNLEPLFPMQCICKIGFDGILCEKSKKLLQINLKSNYIKDSY